MKASILSVLSCALIAAGSLPSYAQVTTVSVNVKIALSGVSQVDELTTTKVKVANKDVINAIGEQTGQAFSSKAKLQLVTVIGEGSRFVVRDGDTDFPVPLEILSVSQVGEAVGTTKEGTDGSVTDTDTSIQQFVLNTDNLAFDVQGSTSSTQSNKGPNGPLEETALDKFSSKVSGSGNGPSVLNGTISASGRKVVVTEPLVE